MSFPSRPAPLKRVLNAGSGPFRPEKLHPASAPTTWTEVRLDIDPHVRPDQIGIISNMRPFTPDASFDAIRSSHDVKHLHAYEVPRAFAEFRRVLKLIGFALITCPDLQAIAQLIADGQMHRVIYTSSAGPITPLALR